MFEPKKFADVFEDMRQRTAAITDFEVGSVARTMYESFAYEIALLYEKMHLTYLSAYVDTAEGAQLDLVVSILGIRRGLPDFAEGTVTFTRDLGKDDVEIPLGTLVTTEEPKKSYQTFAPATLAAGETTVEVKVQAIERGEDQVTAEETIAVMPRPVPGVKSVGNRDATEFRGKRRETDEELRQRAKNALISSGKATRLSIENALLRLSGVHDVKVDERFRFARGEVTLTRTDTSGPLSVPKGTLFAAGGMVYGTRRPVVLADGEASAVAEVRAAVEGRGGELEDDAEWVVEDGALAALEVSNAEPITLGDFGIIDVYVDSDEDVESFRPAVDEVRAAGIFVRLEATRRVELDGVFRVEIDPQLTLSPEDRADFEAAVQQAIEDRLAGLKMGEPLLFAQLTKTVLDVGGIANLETFTIDAVRREESGEDRQTFGPADQRIEVDEFERFASSARSPRTTWASSLCVASKDKPLPVHVRFQAGGLDATTNEAVVTALGDYFAGLDVEEPVVRSAIKAAFTGTGVTLDDATLELVPEPWCERPPDAGEDLAVRFVEQAVLGDVFAYEDFLEITGALALTLPLNLLEAEKKKVYEAVGTAVDAYLEGLPAEADVLFAELAAAAEAVDRVLAVTIDPDDFRVAIGGVEPDGRIDDEKIEVGPFERARFATLADLRQLCITDGIETVKVKATELELELFPPPDLATVGTEITAAVKTAFRNSLTGAEAGQDVRYADLKSALQNLVPGANYQIVKLVLKATSACDGRVQTLDATGAPAFHIRSMELPTAEAIADDNITVTETTT